MIAAIYGQKRLPSWLTWGSFLAPRLLAGQLLGPSNSRSLPRRGRPASTAIRNRREERAFGMLVSRSHFFESRRRRIDEPWRRQPPD